MVRFETYNISGADFIWEDLSPASFILNAEFFEIPIVIGGITYDVATIISSQHLVNQFADLNVQLGLIFGSEHNFLTFSNVELLQNIALSQNTDILQNVSLIFDAIINLLQNTDVLNTQNIETNFSALIDSLSQILNNSTIIADANTSLENNIIIDSLPTVIVNQNLSIGLTSDIAVINNLIIDANANVASELIFNQSTGGSTDAQIIYLTENNIAIEGGKLVQLLTDLYQNSTVQNVSFAEYSASILNKTDNQILINLFLNAFSEIQLLGTAITNFEVLQIIDSIFNLNANSNIVFSDEKEIFVNTEININAGILFDGNTFTIDYTKNENVFLQSKITNFVTLYSEITNKTYLRSKITNQITLNSRLHG